MNIATKICGRLVALIWLACAACSVFYVYLLLTFYIFAPKPISQNFRENRLAVVSWSAAATASLSAAVGVLLARPWARVVSILLCVLGGSFGVAQIFSAEPLDRSVGAGLAVVLLSALVWLFSGSARNYFGRATQPA